MSWLKEMEVIEAVHGFLKTRGFEINHTVKNTTERGTDIIATSSIGKKIIKIETKGQTSSDKSSKRFGKEFDTNQKEDHLGRALLKFLGYLDQGYAPGIVLPDDNYDKSLVDEIRKSLKMLGLVVFLVNKHTGVSSIGDLPP